MATRFLWSIVAALVCAALALPAAMSAANGATASPAPGASLGQGQSEEHGKGKGHGNWKKKGEDDDDRDEDRDERGERRRSGAAIHVIFTTHDRDVIAGFYRGNPSGLPPGLAKRGGNLPPGLERQLARNGHLPPGLEKKMQPFPPELERQLPPLPPDHARVIIGASLVLVNRRTGIVVDVVHNFFGR